LSGTQAATGITPQQRASVVDNMVAAAASLGLDNDSLFLAVALLDRYLAGRPTELQLLQPLLACALQPSMRAVLCRQLHASLS
jgi:hypothetical protein